MKRWIYLSPHFDDVVLSCGGMVWEQVRSGQQVEIWTVCAGMPAPGEPFSDFALSLHRRWQTGPEAVLERQQEDSQAVKHLGARARYWDLPDCIYRRLPDGNWLVNGEDDLWLDLNPQEEPTVNRLSGWLLAQLTSDDMLISPITLGNHVDHLLVRAAAERAAQREGCALGYYADYPYAIKQGVDESKFSQDWQMICQPVSQPALAAWQDAVACYASQISTFWGGLEEMRSALAEYSRAGGGSCLWRA